jgi:hypothetical protein
MASASQGLVHQAASQLAEQESPWPREDLAAASKKQRWAVIGPTLSASARFFKWLNSKVGAWTD